jgi:hypothetical protein
MASAPESVKVDVQIKPDDINRMIVAAVLESRLGEAIKNSADRALQDMNRSWHTSLENICRQEVRALVLQEITKNHQARIVEAVAEQLTGEGVNDIAKELVGKLIVLVENTYFKER